MKFYRECLISVIFILFGVFPLLPAKLKGLPVIFLVLVTLLIINKTKLNDIKQSYNYLLILFSSLFLINFLSIFYTFSFEFPWKKIETSLSLITIPIGFYILNINNVIDEKDKKLFIYGFIASSVILSLFLIGNYISLGLFLDGSLKVNSFRKAAVIVPYLNDHPIYISAFFGISILFSLNALLDIKSKYVKTLLYMIFCLLLFNLFLLSSKGVIISILMASIIYLIMRIKKNGVKILVVISVIFSFIILVLVFPNSERRFRELRISTTYTTFHKDNSTSIRIAIYKCVLKSIEKAPLLGYGWGQSNVVLNECYNKNNTYLFKGNYNSHNQFFGYWLNGGLPALFTLIIFLLFNLRKAIRHNQKLFSGIIIFYIILLLTENILERQSGVILFIFIFTLFGFSAPKEIKDNFSIKDEVI